MLNLNKGVKVTAACTVINFAIGTSYIWSVFANGLLKEIGYSHAEAALPYTVYILFFAFMMIFTGRFQDRAGPRLGSTLSGILAGLAFLFCYFYISSPPIFTLSYGLLFGAAVAFGYAAVTPAALRWFPPQKRGLITGIVVTGHGIAALALAPVVNSLIVRVGTKQTFLVWGLVLAVAIISMAQQVTLPQKNTTQLSSGAEDAVDGVGEANLPGHDWKEIIRRRAFLILWLMMSFTAGSGLMLIANLVQIAELNFQIDWGFFLVSFFSISSAVGRLLGGIVSDRIGYRNAFKIIISLLAFSMFLYLVTGAWQGALVATFLFGLSFGSLFTVFPAAVADLFGMENFGVIYGILFTAVGIGGGFGPLFASYLAGKVGNYNLAFIIGLAACLVALGLTYRLEKKKQCCGGV
jgi:OFA family oxalate/formate antiporter-like MFS transporter